MTTVGYESLYEAKRAVVAAMNLGLKVTFEPVGSMQDVFVMGIGMQAKEVVYYNVTIHYPGE